MGYDTIVTQFPPEPSNSCGCDAEEHWRGVQNGDVIAGGPSVDPMTYGLLARRYPPPMGVIPNPQQAG